MRSDDSDRVMLIDRDVDREMLIESRRQLPRQRLKPPAKTTESLAGRAISRNSGARRGEACFGVGPGFRAYRDHRNRPHEASPRENRFRDESWRGFPLF
jgi:hypothetical protein